MQRSNQLSPACRQAGNRPAVEIVRVLRKRFKVQYTVGMSSIKSSNIVKLSVLAAGLTIALDQSTKWLAEKANILVVNPGGAFSIANSSPQLIVWISTAVLILLLLWYPKAVPEDKILIAFILGAGFSNLADRLTLGGVRDFIDIHWFTIFNVSDLILTVSTSWLVLRTLFRPPR